MRHGHFLRSTFDMGTPHPEPLHILLTNPWVIAWHKLTCPYTTDQPLGDTWHKLTCPYTTDQPLGDSLAQIDISVYY